MAKKKLNPLEDPPTASSSDEEEEVEEQISDDSSSEEEEEELNNPVKTPSAAATSAKPKVRHLPAVKLGKKRQSEKTSKEVNAKRAKKGSEDIEKKIVDDTKKPSFRRLWSEKDEISLLQGMIDFKADTGKSPSEDMDGFYELTRKLISFEASRSQFVEKIRSLKKKYMKKVNLWGVESFCKGHDKERLKLAKYIWGTDEMALGSAVKSNVKKSEKKLDSLKPHAKEVEEVVSDGMTLENVVKSNGTSKKSDQKLNSSEANGEKVEEDKEVLAHGRDLKSLGVMSASDWFEDSFLVGSIASLGVSEKFVKQKWSMVAVESKKRMEEKW